MTKKMTARELKRFYADSTFKKNYIYDGHDLGAACGSDGTVFKLWSPIADRVELHLYPDGDESGCMRSVSMERGEKGVCDVPDGGMSSRYVLRLRCEHWP